MSQAKLDQLRNDSDASRTALKEAAKNLEQCALGSSSRNAKGLWYHVGNCLELANQFVSAADAFVQAGFHLQAINMLFENSDYSRGAKLLLTHWDQLEPWVREPLLDQSRHHFFEVDDYRSLSGVFWSDKEAQLLYARKHGYLSQLKKLLKAFGRLDELSELYLSEKAFSASVGVHGRIESIERAARVAIDYAHTIILLDGRYREHPRKMLVQTIDMVLRYLKQDLEWLNVGSANTIIQHLRAWGSYTTAMLQMANDDAPSSSEVTRNLLGLRLADSDGRSASRINVLEDSLIFGVAHRDKMDFTTNEAGEHFMATKVVDKVIKTEMTTRLHDRLRALHSGLLHSPWSSVPSQSANTQSILNTGSDTATKSATSDDELKSCLHVITLGMCRLSVIRRSVPEFTRFSIAQLWIRRLHRVIYPSTGAEEAVSLIPSLPDQKLLIQMVEEYLREDVAELHPRNHSPLDFFTILTRNFALMALLDRPAFELYATQQYSFKHKLDFTHRHGCSTRSESLAMDLLQFFRARFPESLTRVIYTVHHILEAEIGMDAATLVHLIELITREMIFSSRAAVSPSRDGFAGLLLPLSWAKSLARTQASSRPIRHTWLMGTFLEVLGRLSSELKFGVRGRWTVDEAWVCNEPEILHALNLRLCWCAGLLALNFHPGHVFAVSAMQALRGIAKNTTLPGYTHRHSLKMTPYDSFSTVQDHTTCLRILQQTLRHAPVVLLWNRSDAI
ncbi:hypothetical protein FRC06_008964, partial [Ceratobasidium sp. 370]